MEINQIKRDFPILKRKVHDKPLVYLDNAATTQKPQVVIDAIVEYYTQHNANVHRGIHALGDESTKAYYQARETVAHFLGAQANELIWTRNTTEAINLVANSWGWLHLKQNQVILVSELEHHSNLVTWQELAKKTKATVDYVQVTDQGQIDMADLERRLKSYGHELGLVSLAMISNATGAELNVAEMLRLVKKYAESAKVLLDAAQATPHKAVDFAALDVDFLAFSGHKMYGPMGIGGLLAKAEVIKTMTPMLFGGGMINEVSLEETSFADLPDRFDAGTPNVAGSVGLAAAVGYLDDIGMDEVETHGRNLVAYALQKLAVIEGLAIIGPKDSEVRLGSVAFTLEGIHAHDVAQVLDSEGVAVRSGHHCTMPLHQKFGWTATTRASFGIYNSESDIDALVQALQKVKEIFNH